MKHLKSFNESSLPNRFRYNSLLSKITSDSSGYSDDDARNQASHYVDNVERATGQEVVDVEGTANESEVDLTFKLSDGSTVTLDYREMNSWESGYQQYAAPGTNDRFIVTYDDLRRNSRDRKFKKLSDELQDKYWENEVYYLLKDMVPEPDPEPTHIIKLPLDDDNVFDYDIGHSSATNEIYFLSEEAAKKWLESLTIKIIGK